MIFADGAIRRLFVAAFATSLVGLASAAPVVGSCSPTSVKYMASALDNSSRAATTFANIPEASVTFTQGGASASRVIVRFSAVVYLGYDGVIVRALIDGSPTGLPASAEFSTKDVDLANVERAESFDFIFPSVSPGSHIVHMQFRSINGSVAYVFRHNTIVEHAP